MFPSDVHKNLLASLNGLYGDRAGWLVERLESAVKEFNIPEEFKKSVVRNRFFSHKDSVLITYADSVKSDGVVSLQVLKGFVDRELSDVFTGLHILPFFPFSSDRGFSISDYYAVRDGFGSWSDIESLSEFFFLQWDLVLNHCSATSVLFEEFLKGNNELFLSFASKEAISPADLALVRRPRTSPLLTPYKTSSGNCWVWTTFSPDQVDFDWSNPETFLFFAKVLFFYVSKGLRVVRLDAVTYAFKRLGSSCASLPEDHLIIRAFRLLLDAVAPRVVVLTETNVAHVENISYFGDGLDEAQMVYNFALPPLTLDLFARGDSNVFKDWLSSLELLPKDGVLFNYLDSHDGIGLPAARGLLSDERIDSLQQLAVKKGGKVSFASKPDGLVAYELNVTWWSVLFDGDESLACNVQRYLASRFLAFSLKGLPGIYIHGLVASENWLGGDEHRDVNRYDYDLDELECLLVDDQKHHKLVFDSLCRFLRLRATLPAFSPYASMRVLECDDRLVMFSRGGEGEEDGSQVFVVVNVSSEVISFSLPVASVLVRDIITDKVVDAQRIVLEPYGFGWFVRS